MHRINIFILSEQSSGSVVRRLASSVNNFNVYTLEATVLTQLSFLKLTQNNCQS